MDLCLITAFLLLAVMPVLAAVWTMMYGYQLNVPAVLLTPLAAATVLFSSTYSGFFGHPEVYIHDFAAFGAVSQHNPGVFRKRCGYASMVYAGAPLRWHSFLLWPTATCLRWGFHAASCFFCIALC